ncbi:hypothetical protein [Prescottella equi]|uniref:hypothetical protein n=1 Tax=Rhodococcus hoagii TaxID=43767 RepID=UPI000A1125BD|nr:hypothetical protein [Prescottella equi]ORL15417.1 hypothetical protein A6I85_05950 [Prescottella equi]
MKLPQLTPERRQWIYNTIKYGAPLLVGYGLLASDYVQTWLLFVAAVLGVGGSGLASFNVPTGKHSASADPESGE